MTVRTLAVIPARLGSTRLPAKPLHPLAGRPLVVWTWSRVAACGVFDQVVVATDSEEVARVARAAGAPCELTSPAHPSGTDRVAEVAEREAYRDFQYIVNVQGDEPLVASGQLAAVLELVRDGGWEVATAAAPLESAGEWRDPSVVKVVRADDGGALYFSRAPVPFKRDAEPDQRELAGGAWLRHLGVYAYRREALSRWATLPEGALERIERLEQLRPLAAGLRIGVAVVEPGPGGVDTAADARRVEAVLTRKVRGEP
ncbi:MAG: 3-deoxy-manno-octulosonate cytidylyltransferase [Longimicrobiaceae bacterium]